MIDLNFQGQMQFFHSCYLLVTSNYLVFTSGYLSLLLVTGRYFWLLLVTSSYFGFLVLVTTVYCCSSHSHYLFHHSSLLSKICYIIASVIARHIATYEKKLCCNADKRKLLTYISGLDLFA